MPGSIIELIDERGEGRKERFVYKGGIGEFVALLNKTKEPIHDEVVAFTAEEPPDGRARRRRVVVDIALQWNSTYAEADLSLHEQRPQQGRRHPPHRASRRR